MIDNITDHLEEEYGIYTSDMWIKPPTIPTQPAGLVHIPTAGRLLGKLGMFTTATPSCFDSATIVVTGRPLGYQPTMSQPANHEWTMVTTANHSLAPYFCSVYGSEGVTLSSLLLSSSLLQSKQKPDRLASTPLSVKTYFIHVFSTWAYLPRRPAIPTLPVQVELSTKSRALKRWLWAQTLIRSNVYLQPLPWNAKISAVLRWIRVGILKVLCCQGHSFTAIAVGEYLLHGFASLWPCKLINSQEFADRWLLSYFELTRMDHTWVCAKIR